MSKEKTDSLLFKAVFCAAVGLALILMFTPVEEQNTKLTEYCERVAIYEATKHTDDVRGHRDWDDDMECGE